MKFEDYQQIAKDMCKDDEERDRVFLEYENIAHLVHPEPPELKALDWIRWSVSTDPYDALETAVKILSSSEPRIIYQPLSSNIETKARANTIEKVLKWNFDCANSRRKETIQGDMMRSATLYRAIVANVVDLEWQIKQLEFMKVDSKRWKAMRRYGRFVVNLFNPRDVHVRCSGIMPERVLLKKKKTAQSVIDEWGVYGDTEELRKLAKDNQSVIYFDMMDYENRVIWCQAAEDAKDPIKILPANKWKHDLEFLPWTTIMGGTELEEKAEEQYKPMFYGIYRSNMWKTQNIAQTLWISDVLARASYPRFKEEGVNDAQTTQIDYTDPSKVAKVPIGNTLNALPPEQGDPALQDVNNWIAQQTDKATLSRILIGSPVPAGAAYASVNLQTQNALGTVKPSIKLTERGVAEVLKIMLFWTEHSGIPMTGYGNAKWGEGFGQEFIIEPDTIDPQSQYITVELAPDQPTDRQARINGAAMAVQALDLPKEYALQLLGIEDPNNMIESRYIEKMIENRVQMTMDNERLQSQLAIQGQFQMAMQQGQMAMQQQAQQGGQGQLPGQSISPGQAGPSQAMKNPEATREGQTGRTMSGEETAGLAEMMG